MLNAALTEAYFLLCSNFLQPKLYTAHVHFNLSLSIYFNTVLIVTCLWLFWYQTKLLLDAKMRREESQIRNNVVTFVGWGLLWCSAPDIPRVLTDIPWRSVAPVLIYACQPLLLPPPVYHITLAGAETLDKSVGTRVSALPNHLIPNAVNLKISGKLHAALWLHITIGM